MLCLRHPSPAHDDGVEVFPTRFSRFWERGALRVGIRLSEAEKSAATHARLGLSGISFSGPASDYDIASHPLVRTADVVHLHWVGSFLDWKTFFERVRKPVAWTLHDQNPILGGFHVESERERWGPAAADLDDKLRKRKAQLLATFDRLHVIGPSRWMTSLSRASETLGKFPHSVIRNPVDAAEWRPFDRELARDVLGLPRDGRIALTVAEKPSARWKGSDLLEAALRDPSISGRYLWAAAGSPDHLPESARPLGVLADRRMVGLAYSAADVFIHPSREDNLPNVLLESLVVGTPVVGHPVGGVPEIIEDGVNGTIASTVDAAALAQAIRRADSLQFDRAAIRQRASHAYDPARIAAEYIGVYESLLA
jgi:glycosyltransferase involved in cell wall biosynthesis